MPLTEQQKQHRKARRLWVKALESGKFKWGKSTLHAPGDKFCCLGVACVVADKHGIPVQRLEGRVAGALLSNQRDVMKWLGLSTGAGDFVRDGDTNDLTCINDRAKRNPFKKIAKIIASEPEGLFVD